MGDYCLLVSVAVERGLGSWSRQIGFNVCVRLNDCCTTKPLCMCTLISALWPRRHNILFMDQLHPLHLCVMLERNFDVPHTPVSHRPVLTLFPVLYNTCLLDQTCSLMASLLHVCAFLLVVMTRQNRLPLSIFSVISFTLIKLFGQQNDHHK